MLEFLTEVTDFTLHHLDIGQVEDPDYTSEETRPTTRTLHQGKLGPGHHHGQRDARQTHAGSNVCDMSRVTDRAGKENGVTNVTGGDATRFTRCQTTGRYCLLQEPDVKLLELGDDFGVGSEGAVLHGSQPLFHVKQSSPDHRPGLLL
jgi:hypothetical protein